MASHSIHPDVREHGLADDCERCAELASRPLELDEANFIAAWERMLAVEYDDRGAYPSGNEATLCRDHLYRYAIFLERYTLIDPREILARSTL